jgi:hypothetical protein
LFLFSSNLLAQNWTGIDKCGEFQVKGIARYLNHNPVIIVNEKSRSEIIISVPTKNTAFITPYIDKPLQATVKFEKEFHVSQVEGVIKDIKSRLPNPIDPKDTGFSFVSKGECK